MLPLKYQKWLQFFKSDPIGMRHYLEMLQNEALVICGCSIAEVSNICPAQPFCRLYV